MIALSTWRGHLITCIDGEWTHYEDPKVPTLGDGERACGHCNKHRTVEGHDACLGTLPDVMNACCGHGEVRMAYVQMPDLTRFAGQAALDLIDKLRVEST